MRASLFLLCLWVAVLTSGCATKHPVEWFVLEYEGTQVAAEKWGDTLKLCYGPTCEGVDTFALFVWERGGMLNENPYEAFIKFEANGTVKMRWGVGWRILHNVDSMELELWNTLELPKSAKITFHELQQFMVLGNWHDSLKAGYFPNVYVITDWANYPADKDKRDPLYDEKLNRRQGSKVKVIQQSVRERNR